MKHKYRLRLAGKHTPHRLKSEMLRVDHAGETGAVTIYQGQKTIFSHCYNHQEIYNKIKIMQAEEEKHLEHFENSLPQRQVRPTLLQPLWKKAGYCLGSITALLSKENAMHCTEAVETVIGKHYEDQITYFSKDAEVTILEKFKNDELEHLNIAVHDGSQKAKAYGLIDKIIKNICYFSIKLASKI